MTTRTMRLLTHASPKLDKSTAHGFATVGVHMAPAKLSGFEVCPHRTPHCTDECLNTGGRGQMQSIQQARVRRTLEMLKSLPHAVDRLAQEIDAADRRARDLSLWLACRLNLTSDLPWERIKGARTKATLPQMFGRVVTFYDYTKNPQRAAAQPYSLTFSRSETNEAIAFGLLNARRCAVAVVFSTRKDEELPRNWHGFPVVDGDEHDLTFMRTPGQVIGLRAKGRLKTWCQTQDAINPNWTDAFAVNARRYQ